MRRTISVDQCFQTSQAVPATTLVMVGPTGTSTSPGRKTSPASPGRDTTGTYKKIATDAGHPLCSCSSPPGTAVVLACVFCIDQYRFLEWVAMAHTIGALTMVVVLFGHASLTTAEHALFAHIRAIITGWEEISKH